MRATVVNDKGGDMGRFIRMYILGRLYTLTFWGSTRLMEWLYSLGEIIDKSSWASQ